MSDNSKNRIPKAGRIDVQVNPEMDRAISTIKTACATKGLTLSKSAAIRMAVIQFAAVFEGGSGVNLVSPASA